MAPVVDISKKLFIETAFLEYGRVARVSETDIDELYAKIETLNNWEQTGDDQALDKVIKYDLESIKSKEDLKQRINQIRLQTAEKVFQNIAAISSETEISGVLQEMGIKQALSTKLANTICNRKLAEPLSATDKINFLGRRAKNAETEVIWADYLATNIFNNYANLKKRAALDYNTYQNGGFNHPLVNDLLPTLDAYIGDRQITVEYKTDPQTKPFRKQLRADCNRPDGVMRNFNTIVGLMAENGRNLVRLNGADSNFDKFTHQLQNWYGPEQAGQILNQALDIDPTGKTPADLRQAQIQNYNRKSEEMYVKMVASLLAKKRKFDIENKNRGINYVDYLQTLEQRYIKKLCEGINDVKMLGFNEPDADDKQLTRQQEFDRQKEIRDETAEQQIVSGHHKWPIGAAFDTYDKIIGKPKDANKLAECCKLVNRLGNLCFVIGKDKHQSMEPHGLCQITANQDSLFMASRIDPQALQSAMRDMPQNLQQAVAKHIKPGATDLSVTFKLDESPHISALRKNLQSNPQEINLEATFARLYD